MLLSIADGRPRNVESVRTQSLFPNNIQSGAANIISFIQEYYDYLNTDGLPSCEIGSILTDKDIDSVSNKYLDNIQELIAKNIPNSSSLDKVSLYKIIVKYYNTRGSEDSIVAFFKIFLNETVSIFYPKEYLFTPSSGQINWDPYDVPPLELTAPPVNGVTDTIVINSTGFENLMTAYNGADSLLTLSSTTALTLSPILESENVPITFPPLTCAGMYGDFFAYTGDGTLNNLQLQPYALYWDTFYSLWILRGGAGKTLTISGDLYVRNLSQNVIFNDLYENGTLNNKPLYTSTSDPYQKCYWDSGSNVWIIITKVNEFNPTWLSHENVLTPDLVSAWTAVFDSAGSLSISSSGITAGYWYAESTSIQPPTDDPEVLWDNLISTTSGRPFLHFVDGDGDATQPVDGNVYARYGSWPNRHVYKCTDDGSLPGHSIVWVLQTIPEYVYEDHKGFASDAYKIQDSTYWQNYSYEISSNSDPSTWRDSFLKFVHPAGLKLFTLLLLELQSLNSWDNYISYQLPDLQNQYSWLGALIPPYMADSTVSYHQHSPKYQPGWLTSSILQYVLIALRNDSILLSREVNVMFQFVISSLASERQLVNSDYDLNGLKFRDPSLLGNGFLGDNQTIKKMINMNDESYSYKMLNVSSIINIA